VIRTAPRVPAAPVTVIGLAVLALASTSCLTHRIGNGPTPILGPGGGLKPISSVEATGDVLAAAGASLIYVFERATPPMAVRPASVDLVGTVPPHKHLLIGPLSSTKDTAALIVIEVSIHSRWGSLMIPAERRIIRAFADDRTMGRWLILLTDVVVRGEPDPVPMTAYRWTRDDVERFRACGIPAAVIDDCTDAFYASAKTVFIASGGATQGH
jgi:hypothetical protein